jgi:hypothetical protein
MGTLAIAEVAAAIRIKERRDRPLQAVGSELGDGIDVTPEKRDSTVSQRWGAWKALSPGAATTGWVPYLKVSIRGRDDKNEIHKQGKRRSQRLECHASLGSVNDFSSLKATHSSDLELRPKSKSLCFPAKPGQKQHMAADLFKFGVLA